MRKLVFAMLAVVGLCAFDQAAPIAMDALPGAMTVLLRETRACFLNGQTTPVRDCMLLADKNFVAHVKIRDRKLYPAFESAIRKTWTARGNDPIPALNAWYQMIDAAMRQEDAYRARLSPPGNAPAYNPRAVPVALATQKRAARACQDQTPLDTAKRYECLLTADRSLVEAIKFRDLYRYDSFAARVRLASAAMADSQLSPMLMEDRYNRLRDELYGRVLDNAKP